MNDDICTMKAANKEIHQANGLNDIASLIIELRGQKVILDSDVAAIYDVETKRINEAVRRNEDKFPHGYILDLDKAEWQSLKSQNATSKTTLQGGKNQGGKVKPPKAFTEKGLYMLATILKSSQATEATLQIVETFAKVREFSKVAKSLALEKDDAEQKKLIAKSGELIGDILNQEFAADASSETTIELNLAMIKIKHTIKKKK